MNQRLTTLTVAFAASLAASTAAAQTFPTRAVTMIYPFPAGSSGDVGMRAVAAEMAKTLGQPVVVENRVGGGGILGVNAMKSSAPDGHTITFMNVGNYVVRPAADPSFQFQLGKDYQPVIGLWESYDYIYANPSAPFKDVQGLVAYARANRGKLDLAHGGVGGSGHTALEMFKAAAGIETAVVPYKGAADLTTAVIGGQVPVIFIGLNLQPQVAAGKLVALAYSGPARNPDLPAIPTVAESGLPAFSAMGNWVAVLAPAATPRDVVAKLNDSINAAFRQPIVQERMKINGTIIGGTAEQAATRIRSGIERFGPMLRKLGLKFD